MRILLTNDDGINAKGIRALSKELKKIGNVTVVAPDSERSSVGHGITLAQPIYVKRVKESGKFYGTAISGTPADCVKFATIILMKKKPDLVISGINLGPNDGCSVFYSGTVAAAREGALLGIPSIAVSLATFVNPIFSYAARFAALLAKKIHKQGLPKGTFLNVNIPNKKASRIKGVRVTRQGMVPIHGKFKKHIKPKIEPYYWLLGKVYGIEKDKDVDSYALEKDHITITPLHCDLTEYSLLDKIKLKIK